MEDFSFDVYVVRGGDCGWFLSVSFERTQEICKKYHELGYSYYVYASRGCYRGLVSKCVIENGVVEGLAPHPDA